MRARGRRVFKMSNTNHEQEARHYKVIRFIFKSGAKLHMKSVPLATACHVYHSFFQHCRTSEYDPYLVASSAIYLAGKIEEQHLRIRDVINVTHNTLQEGAPLLDIDANYWSKRDSIIQCEMFIIRVLRFQVTFEHPHKYLVHYLKSMSDWLPPEAVESVPLASTAWAMLRDSYHRNTCLKYRAEHLAVAVLYLTLQCHGVEVPYNNKATVKWWEALSENISLDIIRLIVSELIDTYDMENQSS